MRTNHEPAESTKKKQERWALDRFLALLQEATPDAIESGEEPDFVLTLGLRRVGIEMTWLHRAQAPRKGPRQEQESLRSRVIRRAEGLYADRCLPSVHVSVLFNDQHRLSKTSVTRLAAQMVDWAATRIPQTDGSFEEEYDWLNREYFPEELHSLRIYRFDWMQRSRFSAPDADYVPDLAVSDVQRVLEGKNCKHRAYLRRCGEVWLVVSVNTASLSTTFRINDTAIGTTYESPFDRVFLFQHLPQALFELKRAHGARQDA